jgi:hypothetical protein
MQGRRGYRGPRGSRSSKLRRPRRAREGAARAVPFVTAPPETGAPPPVGRSASPPLDPPLVRLASPSEEHPRVVAPFWLQALPPWPRPRGTGLRGFPARGLLLRREPEESLSWGSTPLQSTTGVHCPPALAVVPPACAGLGRVRLSWGSSSLRRTHSGCPFCHARREPIVGGEVATPRRVRPRASRPLGGFSRDFPRTRVAPCPSRKPLPPELHGLVSCRWRPWDSPCRAFSSREAVPPSDGLVLPCGFGDRPTTGAEVPRLRSLSVARRLVPRPAHLPTACAAGRRRDETSESGT